MKTKLLLILACSAISGIALCSEAPKERELKDRISNVPTPSAGIRAAALDWGSGVRHGFLVFERGTITAVNSAPRDWDSVSESEREAVKDMKVGSRLPAQVLPNNEIPGQQVEIRQRLMSQRFIRHSAGYKLAMVLR